MTTPAIKNLTGGFAPDGSVIFLNVTTTRDESLEFGLSPQEAQKFIAYVLSVMQTAASRQALSPEGGQPPPSTITTAPIEARGIGFAKGRTPSEQLVALDLGPFQLVFAVPDSQSPTS